MSEAGSSSPLSQKEGRHRHRPRSQGTSVQKPGWRFSSLGLFQLLPFFLSAIFLLSAAAPRLLGDGLVFMATTPLMKDRDDEEKLSVDEVEELRHHVLMGLQVWSEAPSLLRLLWRMNIELYDYIPQNDPLREELMVEGTRSTYALLRRAPSESAAWYGLALMKARQDNNNSDLWKYWLQSYWTGPNEHRLCTERLRWVFANWAVLPDEVRQTTQKQILCSAYDFASPEVAIAWGQLAAYQEALLEDQRQFQTFQAWVRGYWNKTHPAHH